jgi:hypothetical protein
VVAAEGPILDLSNSAQMRGASAVSLSQLPDDAPYGLPAPLGQRGPSVPVRAAKRERDQRLVFFV